MLDILGTNLEYSKLLFYKGHIPKNLGHFGNKFGAFKTLLLKTLFCRKFRTRFKVRLLALSKIKNFGLKMKAEIILFAKKWICIL